MRFQNAVLDSLDMANPLEYDLQVADGVLVMNLNRAASGDSPICFIRLQAKSTVGCASCQRGKEPPEIVALLNRLSPRRALPPAPLLLQILPSGGRARLVIRPAAQQFGHSILDDTAVHLSEGTSVRFWREHESLLRGGSIKLSGKDSQPVSSKDSLEIVGVEGAMLHWISFNPAMSILSVHWTARSRQTIYSHAGNPMVNINLRRLRALELNPTFVSVVAVVGSLSTLWSFVSMVHKSISPSPSKEA